MKKLYLSRERVLCAAILVLLLTMVGLTKTIAQTFTVGNLNYSLNEDGASVTVTGHVDGTAATGELVIPESVENGGASYSVTIIGEQAFYQCSNLTSIVIPNSIITIAEYAFYSCSNLTSIDIPNSVTTIESHAFSYSGLTSIIIPNSITIIENSVFSYCTGLTSVEIPNTVTVIGDSAFYFCSSLTSIEIPSSVTSLGSCAFNNSGLTSIEIPSSVTSLGSSAFYNSSLTSIVIPNSITIIENGAFEYCTKLTSVEIPNSVTAIGDYAFSNCSKLPAINIPNTTTTIGNSAFSYCVNLTSVEIPNSVISIGYQAFYHCTKLISVEMGNSIETISGKAFSDCDHLTSMVMPNSVITIGQMAFAGCTRMTSLEISNSVEVIDYATFSHCDHLTSVVIPNSVRTIGNSAFNSCTRLASVVLGNSVETIEAGAFQDCVYLTSIEIPPFVDDIGDFAFYGCIRLASVELGNSVETIGNRAFSGCSNLTSITFPNTLVSIGNYAFSDCLQLTSVEIPASVESIGIPIFNNCTALEQITVDPGNLYYDSRDNCNAIIKKPSYNTNVHELIAGCKNSTIPNTVTAIGTSAFDNCSGLTTVKIPNSVTTIEGYAFYACSALTTLEIGNSVSSIGYNAFYDCVALASITVHAETPPAMPLNHSYYVFYNVNKTIPVYVPIGTVEAYQTADVWGDFTNIQEMAVPFFEITTVANPTEGGIVAGEGIYAQGETCTLTATANTGYAFQNWTENGEVVSTDAAYTFTVESGRTLVANFRSIANHWTPESSGYSDNMALTGVIQIDGVEQRNEALEVGVFCGEECRGAHMASYFPPTDRYVVMLTVYGNSGDNLTFKIYDHDAEQELDLISPSTVVFNTDGYGSPIAPYVLNFTSTVTIAAIVTPTGAGTVTGAGEYFPGNTCTLTATANTGYQFKNWTLNGVEVSTNPTYTFTVNEASEYVAHFQYAHTQALASGWNWYSTYIEQDGINGLEMLENSLGSAGVRIQGRNGYVDQYEYQGTYSWYGTLNSINNEQMYKIRTNATCNAVMTGDAASAANHPITINSGWNWIGFPVDHSVSVENAMSGFTPVANDVIKGRNGYTTYIDYSGYTMWYGTLNTLEPGQGYMYQSYSSTPRTLVFQTGGKGELVANITAENNVFVPNDTEFANNMTVTAVIDIEGEELHSDDYELAAFVGDECRGSVKLMYVEPIGRYVAFLTIFGENEDNLSFVLTDGTETRWSTTQMSFSSDATVGTLTEPATICFGTLSLNDNVLADAVVYPNPSSDVFNIRCEGITKIEVLNIYGQVVMSKESATDNLQIDLGDNAAGAYILRIYTNNGMIMKNLVKSK